ncbi:MAG: SH3 domain-containing protein [Coleofasciculaceae cyanobacterium]
MPKIIKWSQPFALVALVLFNFGEPTALATVTVNGEMSNLILDKKTNKSDQNNNFQLVQSLEGQCRAAANSIFIYRERSTSNSIRALQADEQVTLAEERGRDGWIAINSPISGFVEAEDLKLCPKQVPPRPPNRPINRPSNPVSNRCRRVTYNEPEGLAIRERPDPNSNRVGGVFLGDKVTLSNPPQFRQDEEKREWVKVITPVNGWVSNGFPSTGGINLEACLQ